ncbi:hypothetical protein ACNKHM_17980 [Shigella sonnei]
MARHGGGAFSVMIIKSGPFRATQDVMSRKTLLLLALPIVGGI